LLSVKTFRSSLTAWGLTAAVRDGGGARTVQLARDVFDAHDLAVDRAVETVVVLRREARHRHRQGRARDAVELVVRLVLAVEQVGDRELSPLDPAVSCGHKYQLPERLGGLDRLKHAEPAVGGTHEDVRVLRTGDGASVGLEAAGEEGVERGILREVGLEELVQGNGVGLDESLDVRQDAGACRVVLFALWRQLTDAATAENTRLMDCAMSSSSTARYAMACDWGQLRAQRTASVDVTYG
jgi:hypothetical protein